MMNRFKFYFQILTKVSPKSRLYETILYFLKSHLCEIHTHTKEMFCLQRKFLLEKLEEIEHNVAINFYNS
jgi:hypothetical protein